MGVSHVPFLELGVFTLWKFMRPYTSVWGNFAFVKSLPKKGLVKCLRTWGTTSAGKRGPLGLSFKLFELSLFLWKMGTNNSTNLKLQLCWVSWIESNSHIVNTPQILVHYNQQSLPGKHNLEETFWMMSSSLISWDYWCPERQMTCPGPRSRVRRPSQFSSVILLPQAASSSP